MFSVILPNYFKAAVEHKKLSYFNVIKESALGGNAVVGLCQLRLGEDKFS